jgi:hypothetical protein
MKSRILAAIVCAVLVWSAGVVRAEQTADLSGVFALLDVLDAIMAKHPDHAQESKRIAAMDEEARRRALDEKAAENSSDKEIARRLDALYATPAYKMYFLQFRRITPEVHRAVLLALPYEAISSPAGISHNLQELCFHRDEVRRWAEGVVMQIDLDHCRDLAEEWLPPGDYRIPGISFIYDGNGDAFALWGRVCFDLFSLVLRDRPRETRFDDLAGVGVERVERVLAHEFHHIFARTLRKPAPAADGWVQASKYHLGARIVSEGVAMRCDLGAGMRRAAMEDTATVESWIAALKEKFAALDAGTLSQDEWERWLGTTYDALARERLRDFLSRTHPDSDVDVLLGNSARARPTMVYTLGWWMISRILEEPDGRDRVLALLAEPWHVFEWYNEAVGDGPDELRVPVP